MPVHQYDIAARHNRPDLVADIATELRLWKQTAAGNSPPDPPEIFWKEGAPPDYPIRIYVVWRKWSNVEDTKRAGVIIDAMESAGLADEAKRTVIAMGLTPDEAESLGIRP